MSAGQAQATSSDGRAAPLPDDGMPQASNASAPEEFGPDDFSNPTAECDVIMQGGITSGVVYPRALIQLARQFRFRNIGGASAGGIAAAIAAAAEYGRDNGSFVQLQSLPATLAKSLVGLFQPTPKLRGLHNAFLAGLNRPSKTGKVLAVAWHVVRTLWWVVPIGMAPAFIFPWAPWSSVVNVLLNLFGIFAMLLTVVLLLAYFLIRRLNTHLPRQGFGLCPGLRQKGYKQDGLTDWLSAYIDQLAGRPSGSPPLTFGELRGKEITLQMMTTNLSMRRPYRLPMRATERNSEPEYALRKDEWQMFFPKPVIDAVTAEPVPNQPGYFWFPEPDSLPVVVAVRMSLSFPFLLSAIPLHRKDRSYRSQPKLIDVFRRCVFSDGGITSNFPIHFFDSILPTRPTFAIALEDYVPERHGPDTSSPPKTNRVYMPRRAGGGINIPINPITSVFGFVGSIVTSARVWQDQLQGVLSGYRERIVHIALDNNEGGLNLNMDADRIEALTDYGNLAGKEMLKFDLNEHFWRRFLVSYSVLEKSLEDLHDAYDAVYRKFLTTYTPQSYPPRSAAWMNDVRTRVDDLYKMIAPWRLTPLRLKGTIPKPPAVLRTTPEP